MKKFVTFLKSHRLGVMLTSIMSLFVCGIAVGAEGATTVGVSDFQSVITAITSQISVSTIVAVLAAVIGITVGIAFMWWGARYASRKIMAALSKGKTGA